MGISPFTNGNQAGLVDEMIGTAYKTVRQVAENIEYVKHVSANMAEVYRLVGSIDAVDTLVAAIDKIDLANANAADISTVADNIAALLAINADLIPLNDVQAHLPQLLDIQANLQTFLDELATLTAVGGRVTTLENNAYAMDNMVEGADTKILTAAERDLITGALQHSDILDEDDMASDSATKAPSQQSVKAYVASASAINLPAPVASTFLQRNSGNTAYDTKAAADVRLALTAPVYVSRAQMIALDTTKDTVAFVSDTDISDWFQWVSGDLSARTVLQSLISGSVTPAADTITIAAHGLSTGAGLMPTTTVDGVTANTAYYAIIIDANNIKLAASPTAAIAGAPVVDITGSTNFTMKQLRDPLQKDFIIKTGAAIDGTAGAWIRNGASHGFGLTAWTYKRFPDRVLFGRGATGWYGDANGMGSSGAGSWLGDEIAPGSAYAMSYLLVGAQVASVPDYTPGMPVLGVLGAARTPDGATSAQNYGISGFASGHGTSGSSVVWGAYIEAVKRPTSNTTTQAVELEVTNLNSTPVNPVISSEATYVQGRTFGVFIASGGGNTTSYDADSAIFIGSNQSAFRTGITFYKNSLTKDASTNYQHAIILPNKARIEWDTSDGNANDGFTIHSEVSDAAHQMFMIASNSGITITNTGGKIVQSTAYVASAVNYLAYSPSAAGVSPNFQALGDDANLDVQFIGKGTGGGRLRDGGAVNKFQYNTTGIGFFNTAPVAKATVGAALSTGGAETNVNLATRINELRTALINYGLAS